jgi:hypothetical protein
LGVLRLGQLKALGLDGLLLGLLERVSLQMWLRLWFSELLVDILRLLEDG